VLCVPDAYEALCRSPVEAKKTEARAGATNARICCAAAAAEELNISTTNYNQIILSIATFRCGSICMCIPKTL